MTDSSPSTRDTAALIAALRDAANLLNDQEIPAFYEKAETIEEHAIALEAALASPGDGPLAWHDGTFVRMEPMPGADVIRQYGSIVGYCWEHDPYPEVNPFAPPEWKPEPPRESR